MHDELYSKYVFDLCKYDVLFGKTQTCQTKPLPKHRQGFQNQ